VAAEAGEGGLVEADQVVEGPDLAPVGVAGELEVDACGCRPVDEFRLVGQEQDGQVGIGAVQGSGDRYQDLPYRHWSRSGLPDYPEHPRPVAARWSSAGTSLDLSVEFAVPIALAADVTATLPGRASSQPCTVRTDRTLDCRFPSLDAAPDPATEIHLGAGIIARAPTCGQRLPATDWGAEPPQIRIAAPVERTGRC